MRKISNLAGIELELPDGANTLYLALGNVLMAQLALWNAIRAAEKEKCDVNIEAIEEIATGLDSLVTERAVRALAEHSDCTKPLTTKERD
jgi:uncharacterized protein YbbC (DUF1343 family)